MSSAVPHLGKAVTYALNQKPYMENYLLDGRCSLSNNAAENAIRPFTVGRKNRLFADTPKGASATDWHNNPEFLDEIMSGYKNAADDDWGWDTIPFIVDALCY